MYGCARRRWPARCRSSSCRISDRPSPARVLPLYERHVGSAATSPRTLATVCSAPDYVTIGHGSHSGLRQPGTAAISAWLRRRPWSRPPTLSSSTSVVMTVTLWSAGLRSAVVVRLWPQPPCTCSTVIRLSGVGITSLTVGCLALRGTHVGVVGRASRCPLRPRR